MRQKQKLSGPFSMRHPVAANQRRTGGRPERYGAAIELQEHLRDAFARAHAARARAEELVAAGFPDAALVWAVRASEIFVREFVLAPHYVQDGDNWTRAVRKARRDLDKGWAVAMSKAEDWYGPFDEPLTTDGQNAWVYWKGTIVRRRAEVVHGNAAPDVTEEEALLVIGFARRLSSWWVQRFVVSDRHPLGQSFMALLRDAVSARDAHKAAES